MMLIFSAVIKMVFIIFLGFYLYRKEILKEEALNFLTLFVINITVPFLIFSNIATHFNPLKMPSPFLFLGISTALFLIGLLVGIISSLTAGSSIKREFILLVSFQNCGYLPMTLSMFLFDIPRQRIFLNYIFLYILGFNILMWSVASYLILKKKEERFRVNSLFTPPILSIVVSLVLVYSGLKKFIPQFIIPPIEMIGKTSFVLSMIVLGGWLAKSSLRMYIKDANIIKVIFIKLVVIPLIVFVLILKIRLYSLLGLFILIEASMPSAASLPIVASIHGADSKFISYGVFVTHLVSIATIPIWIELFVRVASFNF